MALVCALVYLPMLFAIFEFSFAMYGYTFVSDMARQATRYSAVRGSFSCVIAPSFPNCNLGPGGANTNASTGSAVLQSYVQSLGYPGINTNNITVTATWISPSVNNPGNGNYSTTTWPSTNACTSTTAGACNPVGTMVNVTVTYAFPLTVPFWNNKTLNLSSTSQMMINE